jgi:hypothetical protein
MFFLKKTTYLFAEMIIIDHPSKPGLVLEEKGLAVPQQGQAGAAGGDHIIGSRISAPQWGHGFHPHQLNRSMLSIQWGFQDPKMEVR